PIAAHSVSGAEVNGWLSPGALLTLTAEDALSGVAGVEYRVDGGAWAAYTTPTPIAGGVSNIEYRATDIAGNVSDAVSARLRVDDVEPAVTVRATTDAAASGWHLEHPEISFS